MRTNVTRRQAGAANWLALVAALTLLVGSGIGYRWAAAHFAGFAASIPLPEGTLARLPMRIGNWTGRDRPMEESIIKATDTDDRLNRVYIRRGAEAVGLYVGYGVRFRDLMPHRPEVCYPGAGWGVAGRETVELRAADGSVLPCQIYRFRRGGLTSEQIAVLNYYIVGGQYSPTVDLLRAKAAKADRSARYVVQVQVSSTERSGQQGAGELASAFAAECAPDILRLVTEAVEAALEPIPASPSP